VNGTIHQKPEYQIRAEEIRSRFTQNARRPIVLEFAGSPKAGKTTVVNQIAAFLKRCGFRTKIVVERASICPIRDKRDFAFNVWTACQSLAALLEDTQEPPAPNDPQVLILDRGLFDTTCWLSMLQKLARLRDRDRQLIEQFVLLPEWRNKISLVFLLTASPEDSLQREQGFLPVVAAGSIMNREVLERMLENCFECARRHEKDFRIIPVDTSTRFDTPQKATEYVLNSVLDVIDQHLDEHILYAERALLEPLFADGEVLRPLGAGKVLQIFAERGKYASRAEVETDASRIQALPVVVVRNKDGDVLQLRRREREKQNPLDNKIVVWAGGHVRNEDGLNGRAIFRCITREIYEELKLSIQENEIELKGAIWSTAAERTARHLALVFEWRAKTNEVAVTLSNAEFFERRGTSLSGKFIPLAQFSDPSQLEPWSAQILSELLDSGTLRGQRRLL
jgi:predicted NUDIX family phosphoesterase/thymidylate kinase